jgi:hypothetical protein
VCSFSRVVGAMTSNYRGIVILSAIVRKLFELLVYRFVYEDLRGRLADFQHGFVKGKSTVSFVLKSIEDGCQVDSIYKNFSNAFDRVRHSLLLDKMSSDVEPSRRQWLRSYFSGRIQRITMFREIFWLLRVFFRAVIWGHSASSGL